MMSTVLAILLIAIPVLLFLVLMMNAIVSIVSGCADLLEWFYDGFHCGISDPPLSPTRKFARYIS